MKTQKHILLIAFLLVFSGKIFAQKILVTGKLADSKTREAMIGAAIYLLSDRKVGTITNAEGNFSLSFEYRKDTLVFEYTGYKTKKIPLTNQARQVYSLLLEEEATEIEAITITPGENPAYAIMRKVVKNKSKNDKRSLQAYECDTYNRIEGYVKESDKGLSNLRVVKDMAEASKKTPALRDIKGKALIPILVSESFSRFFYLGKPEKEREDVKTTNLTGLGLESAEGFGQILTGGKLNEYNFYRNQMNILDKYFTSPIAEGWRLKYDYDLLDSVLVDKDTCYLLNIVPRNRQDLVFEGKMWITMQDYALKKIDVQMTKEANINFVKGIKIKQTLFRSQQGAWLPEKTDFEVEISEFSEILPNIYVKTHTQHQNYLINLPKSKEFYNELPPPPQNEIKEQSYWQPFREKDSTLVEQVDVYAVIDSLKTITSVKRYTTALTILSTGYYEMKGIDFGHYARYYAWNDVEGHRLGFSMRTNYLSSRNFTFKGRVAYGIKDTKFKYGLEIHQVLSRKYFTQIGLRRSEDIEPLIILTQSDNLPDIFVTSSRFFQLSARNPFFKKETACYVESQVAPSWKQKLTFQQRILLPEHAFAYKTEHNGGLESNIHTNEIVLQTTFRKGGNRVRLLDNSEIYIGGGTTPKITLTSTFGFQQIAGKTNDYQQFILDVSKKNARMGSLGYANYFLSAGYIFGKVPFPLLRVHLGNNTPFLVERAFNQMNGFEFVSDHYVSVNYSHYLEGFLFNRLPLFKKANKFLDWRLVLTCNAIWGGMRPENRAIIAQIDPNGNPLPLIQNLTFEKPYLEIGYGIDNILKFFRVDFFHRLTYLDRSTAKPFGIKFSAEVKL